MERILQDFLEYFLCGHAIVHSDLDPVVEPRGPNFAQKVSELMTKNDKTTKSPADVKPNITNNNNAAKKHKEE